MAVPQTPNDIPTGGESPDDGKNEAISQLLERLSQIEKTNHNIASQRNYPQRHIAPSTREKPPEPSHTAASLDEPPQGDSPPTPIESDPLPINTRYEQMQNLRRARQQQARITRRRAWKNLKHQTKQQITRAVDFSNRWINRLVSFAAGVGATCILILFIQFWAASDTTREIQLTKPTEALRTSIIVQTITPPPTLSVVWDADANPQYMVIPPHTHPHPAACWVEAENIEISPNIPYNTGDEPTLRLWTQVNTEGCEGRSLRVSLSITRSDGQPLYTAHNDWVQDTAHQLMVEGSLSVRDDSPIPIVLEVPHQRFPLAPGIHSLSGYLHIRDENTDVTLYNRPLEPFMLSIAP